VAGFDIQWEGSGRDEVGRDAKTGAVVIDVDPRYYRPAEVEQLQGDPSKAREKLGWQTRVSFSELVELMMKADLASVS
jgi:GDPmannose 4,6-dehydratase